MLVVLYEGDSSDPLQQRMRLIKAESLEAAREAHPHAIAVSKFEKPARQEPVNLARLKRGMPVWSF